MLLRLVVSAPLVSLAFTLLACGSGSTSVLAPGPVNARCAVTLEAKPAKLGAAGGTGTIAVITARECQWAMTGQPSWMTFSSPTSGQGPAEIAYAVDANRSTSPRSTQLTVSEQPAVIVQEAATCAFKVAPERVTIGAGGGTVRAQVTTDEFCSWEAKPAAGWISVSAGSQGQGAAEITLRVARNEDEDTRTATVDIAGAILRVLQHEAPPAPRPPPPAPAPPKPLPPAPVPPDPEPPPPEPPPPPPPPPDPCTFDVSRTEVTDVAAAGATVTIDVKTRSDCTWNAGSNAEWITIPSSQSRTGSGSVQLTVMQNADAARDGTVVVAGRTITVSQRSGLCTYTLSRNAFQFSSAERDFSVLVITQSGCPVSATSQVSWIEVESNPRTGSGEMKFELKHNRDEDSRTGSVTIAGRNFTASIVVTQAGESDDD